MTYTTYYPTVHEQCSCDAEITLTVLAADIPNLLKDWRENHHHEFDPDDDEAPTPPAGDAWDDAYNESRRIRFQIRDLEDAVSRVRGVLNDADRGGSLMVPALLIREALDGSGAPDA